MNRASHAFGVRNQRAPVFCGEIRLCGKLRPPSGGPESTLGPTVTGCGRHAAAIDDGMQERTTFHVKHDVARTRRGHYRHSGQGAPVYPAGAVNSARRLSCRPMRMSHVRAAVSCTGGRRLSSAATPVPSACPLSGAGGYVPFVRPWRAWPRSARHRGSRRPGPVRPWTADRPGPRRPGRSRRPGPPAC